MSTSTIHVDFSIFIVPTKQIDDKAFFCGTKCPKYAEKVTDNVCFSSHSRFLWVTNAWLIAAQAQKVEGEQSEKSSQPRCFEFYDLTAVQISARPFLITQNLQGH